MTEADDPAATWRRLAERAIGAGPATLKSQSAEGLTTEPLYGRCAADPPQPSRYRSTWSVAQRIDHPDVDEANRLARLDLEGGVDALALVGGSSPCGRGFGLDLEHLDRALEAIELDLVSLRLDAGTDTEPALAKLVALVEQRRLTSASLAIDIGYDPIGWGARLGRVIDDETPAILEARQRGGLGGSAFLADGRPWHEAGAGEAQELAAVLATGVAYLRRQEALGIGLDEGRDAIACLLAMDADIFLGLAKVRAMRRLWARVETACGMAPRPLRLHAETSWRMMSRYDPWTNVMRTTAAAFAAGLGGADAITILPFTLPLGLPDAAARRLARNLQHVLLDEAHLAKVADPAAGAGSFETLTETLCFDAWRQFQEIEQDGGIEHALPLLKRRIAETARRRAEHIGTLEHGIIGTSRFASLDAPAIEVLDIALRPALPAGPDALPILRDAAPFEVLRDRAEAVAAEGRRPRIFLATLGPPAGFGTRATYAANFFAAAGIAAFRPDERTEDIAQAFTASGARVACLCGSDESYIEAASMASALRAAGALRVLCAGAQGVEIVTGIDAFIHDGCNALQVLAETLEIAIA